jgi:hypothetical protein
MRGFTGSCGGGDDLLQAVSMSVAAKMRSLGMQCMMFSS